jgi:hypothetical protein
MWSAYCRANVYDTLAAGLALADAPSMSDKTARGLDWRARNSVVAGLTSDSSFALGSGCRLHGVLRDDESEVIIASHVDTFNKITKLRVFAFRLSPDSADSAADDEAAVAPLAEHELFVLSTEQFGRQELGFNRGKGYDLSDFDIRVGRTMDVCFAVGRIDCWAMTVALPPRVGEETVGAEREVVLRGLATSREATVHISGSIATTSTSSATSSQRCTASSCEPGRT